MKRQFIKYLLHFSFLSIAATMPNDLIFSCGPSLEPDQSRFALFRQGLDGKSGFRPFQYSEALFNTLGTDPDKADYKRNCAEWVSFCGGSVRAMDVFKVQYSTAAEVFLTAYNKHNWSAFKKNTFINWLLKKDNRHVLDYMVLAKQAEATQNFNSDADPWDTSGIRSASSCLSIAVKADKALQQETWRFLKERYAFQAVKMYYYGGSKNNTSPQLHKLYDAYLMKSKSIVAGWALVYYAMTQNNPNRVTTFLLYAFDKTEEKKEFAYLQISNDDLVALEKTHPGTHMLALINTMKAVKNMGRALEQLKTVYRLEPNSQYLPLLVSREINKLENWLWSPEMLMFPYNDRPDRPDDKMTVSYNTKLQQKDRQYLQAVTTFIESLNANDKSHTAFIQLALVHLYCMQGNFAKAGETLQKIAVIKAPKLETQRMIEQVIITAHLQDVTEPAVQQQLAAALVKLIALNPSFIKQTDKAKYDFWGPDNNKENNDDLSELFILLSHCFEAKGDRVSAGLLYNKANLTVNSYDGWNREGDDGYGNIAYFDRNCSPADMEQLIRFKHAANKTSFQRLISPDKWAPDDHYKDLQGTMLFRQKKYREALAVFQTVRPNYWSRHKDFYDYLPNTTILRTSQIPSEKSQPAFYRIQSKMLLVKDIVNLLNTIAATNGNADKAVLYYKLGNAYFNTTYYGKAWIMFSYGKSVQEGYYHEIDNYRWAWFDFYPIGEKYATYYYQCNDAAAMYKKALSLTPDKELAAKCLLMLSVCDRNRHEYLPDNTNSRWPTGNQKSYSSPYLTTLKSKYSNTVAYREAAVTCPDVR